MRRKKSKGRSSRRKNNKTKANRDMLMGLISKEMNDNWNDDDGDEQDLLNNSNTAEDTSKTFSPAEIFYAQMNGEDLDGVSSRRNSSSLHSTSTHSTSMVSSDEDLDLLLEDGAEQDFADHTSFAGLALPSCSRDGTLQEEKLADGLSLSHRSSSSRSSRSESSNSETTLSINEIQDYVMNNMPDEVKNKIPKEAWGRIFGKVPLDKTRKPQVTDVVPFDEEDGEEEKGDEADEDSSVVSDITEFTDFQKARRINHTGRIAAAPIAPEESKETEEEELCPMLPADPFIHSERSSGLSVDTTEYEVSTRSRQSKRSGTAVVTFDKVQVRYYERILEVNPAVTNGAAIGIGWRYRRGGVLPIDDWEMNKERSQSTNDLILPRHVREEMLKDLGYTQHDIATATRIVLKAKNNRKITVNNLPNQHMEEAVERAARKVKGLLSFGKKKGLVSTT